jgi:hypothetical protein
VTLKTFVVLQALLALAAFTNALAQDSARSEPGVIHATRVNVAPVIDGVPNDSVWNLASPLTSFTQRELHEGAPATERTEVRIVYDERNLYIGVWCYDSLPEAIVANELKRDFNVDVEDDFGVILDTHHDRRNGFMFYINPNGARYDALVTDEGQGVNPDWNALWDVRTSITPEGWFAEIEIPFSTLRFSDDPEQVWGINFVRNIRRKQEQDLWQAHLRNFGFQKLSQAGVMIGLKNIRRGNALEVKPYILAGVEHGYAPYSDARSTDKKLGLDIKYSLTPTLTLDVTTNTDFAQVEADRVYLNLTRFPLYFPEKRDFFLEGAGMFDTQFGDQPVLFYSRRIGISASRELTPILGGIRLVGKAGPLNVGALTMETAEASGEPATNYAVVRVKRDLADQSYFGFMATNKQSSLSFNRLFAVDGAMIRSDVFGSNTLIVGGVLAGTVNPGVTGNNLAYRIYADFPNDFINHFIGYRVVQENFDPQMGFADRTGFRKYSYTFSIRPRPEGIGMQYIQFTPVEVDYYTNMDGSVQSMDYEGRLLGFKTNSGEYFEWNIQRFADSPTDTTDFFGNDIDPSTYWWSRWELQFGTNPSRPISFWSLCSWGGFYNGKRQRYTLQPQARLGGHLTISLDYTRNEVQLPTGSFITDEAGASLEYGISTRLNSSILAQWNNQDKEINLNFRLHWIPRIGSDAYLVLNQAFDASGRIDPSRTTIVAKMSYLFIL